ncbi:MAG: carboxypeptidase-like regulatory domain-containing protein [Pseudomonadales bacterium]|nr:carboxypeptidase-like regulatory domain-containing protein [Pseudomonadales bacterium]
MNSNQVFKLLTASSLAISLSLVGCSSSNNGSTGGGGDKTQSISGVVSDPEVQGASVVLRDGSDDAVGQAVITGADGTFTISGIPKGDLAGYRVVATGGIDVGTGESLDGMDLTLPLDMYEESGYGATVVTPITSLIDALVASGDSLAEAKTAVAAQLGLDEVDLASNPVGSASVMSSSMKLTLLRKEGQSFSDIYAGLTGDDGLDEADLASITDLDAKARLVTFFGLLDSVTSTEDLENAYQEAVIRRTVRLSLKDELAALTAPDDITIANNLHALAQYMLANIPTDAGRDYLIADDVVATISASGFLIAADVPSDDDDDNPEGNLNNSGFDASRFAVKLVNLDATFSDTLKLAFYTVNNPLTGNEQLVVHDATTGTQKVIKTDIILGNRAFVFEGHTDDGKEVYDSRKFGIFLDPSQSKETRSAPNGYGGTFEYSFYFDNVFKRYNIASPADETVIYGSSLFPQTLAEQGITALADEYTLYNNISDVDNSYVELKVFESLPDVLKGESESALLHGPILVRMGDSAMVQGHMIRVIKDTEGATTGVLSFYEAIHKSGSYPEAEDERTRLQLCQAVLDSCTDVTAVGGMGDGKFYYQAENDDYVYMARHGTDTLYAYKKSDQSLSEVTGASFPATFNHKIHTLAGAAHGSGDALRSGFSNISGSVGSLSDGENAYVRINYDGDATDSVGSYTYLGDIHVYKHTQILKFSGTTGVTMFDNGDGIDQADESDAENVVGHANLIATVNGRLFVEIGNYEAGVGGSCTPDMFGYGCSSVYYGYLNSDSVGKTELDTVLKSKALLRYFVARRIAPYALADKLYISTFVESSQPYEFTLDEYDITDPVAPLSTTTGRTYFTKAAQGANGVYDGTVLSWDGATGILTNLSSGESMGVVHGTGSVIPGDPAINSVSGLTSGVPVAGIGNLFALKADPGGHRFYLIAGEVDDTDGVEYVDQVPFSSWLYE